MEKRKSNILKGSIIALLCLVLVAGVVLSALQPGRPGTQPDNDQLSSQGPTPNENPAPDDPPAPPTGTEPSEPRPEPRPTEPKPTQPAPTEPEASEPEVTEPEKPENNVTILTGNVSVENMTVTEDASFGDGNVSVKIPAGVQLNENTSSLTLTITEKDRSDSGVTLLKGETMLPLDVHIDGISAGNTAPITVSLGTILPKGLNIGNYSLYHVENGVANKMNAVYSLDNLSTHNDFLYNPVNGNVTVSVASFSELTLVSEESVWEGEFDFSWYDASKTELTIANADQLAAFGAIVGNMQKDMKGNDIVDANGNAIAQDSFEGKTVKLLSDINLGDAEATNNPDIIFYPIGYWNDEGTYEKSNKAVSSGFYAFMGTFDGNNNTISNIYQNTWEMKGDHDWYAAELQYFRDGMGLFGKVYGGTVKNLTVKNFSCDSEIGTTGVIAAYADSIDGRPATFENISIFNCNPRVYNIGNGGIVGCAGWYSRNEFLGNKDYTNAVTFRNITVDQTNKISALWGSWGVSCAGILGQYYPNSACGIKLDNCHVAAIIDVNNDVCSNYQYYWYRYAGMFIGTIRANTKDANGYTVADTTGVSAEGCTYTMGDWNEYWYCELVVNSLASYTHDHQFGRLDKISDLSEIQDENGNWNKEGNFVIPAADNSSAECYHIFKNSEGNLYQHFHDVADESNPNIYETFDLNGDGLLNDLKEDRQRYFIPFNQLLTGLDMGVKAHYEFEGITPREDGLVLSEKKFEVLETIPACTPGQTITLGQLVSSIVDDSKLSKASIYAAVSPATENGTVSATYTLDLSDWRNSTITFAEGATGLAKIVITDYFYCTPTEIFINVAPAEKFTANDVFAQNAYSQITLGDLFGIKNGATIGNVTATVTDPNGKETDVNSTSANWATKTIDLTKDGEWMVVIKDDSASSAEVITTFTVNKVDVFESNFEGDFLYRVGNTGDVAWDTIFDVKTVVAPVNVNVEIANEKGNAAGTFANGKITFSGTGVVKVTITADAANAKSIYLEVVAATNVINYSELKDQTSVLLSDIVMANGGAYRLTGNKTLYGNGFTFNAKNGAYAGVDYDYASYVIYLENSNFDNVKIEGAVYPQVGNTKTDDYYRAIVMTSGDCKITNSYISNGASPIRNGGNLELVNTTLRGGAYANLDLRNGHLILDNVTTVNQVGANEKYNDTTEIVGMGIVVYQEGGTEDLKITVRNSLTQYNYLSKTQADELFTDTYSSNIKDVVFGSNFENYQYEGWINFGIISMNNYFTGETDLVDERTDKTGYFGTQKEVSLLTQKRNCYVYSCKPTSTTAPAYGGYSSAGQGVIAPTVDFDYTSKNYQQKVEGSNDYCYEDAGVVYISMDEGDTVNWDASILTATKCGNTLAYTVTMNGIDYTGKTIAFNTADTYTVQYSFTDGYNYQLNGETVESFNKEYVETVIIEVAVVAPDAQHAVFSFGANGTTYSAKTVMIGDKTYVMPDVTATVSGKVGSTTVNGTTVYYPITEMYTSDGKTEHTGSWYACFPIFKDALQIIDYADGGVGDPVTYNQKNVTTVAQIPSSLKATNPTSAFLYSMNATNYPPPTDPTAVSGAVCYTCNRSGLTSGNTRNEMTITAEYTYTDNAGAVYYYYIGYHCAAQTKGECVTGETLVTLADGTQVRVDQLTGNEELLVWNLETGRYDSAPIVFVDADAEAEVEIITLTFSDGSEVKVIYEHGFFDYDLGKYVYLDSANAESYIGHRFVTQGDISGNTWNTATLTGVTKETKVAAAYSPVTFSHLCYYVDGVLSMPGGIEGLFNIFDVDTNTMSYDAEKKAQDIETYGLYTYEDFAGLIPEEAYYAFNGAYLKVAIGKGLLTWEEIEYLAQRYVPLM